MVMGSNFLYRCLQINEIKPTTVLLLLLLMFVLLYWWYERPASSPPGPRGLPLIGVAATLVKKPQVALKEWSKNFGPVMSVRVGRSDWIILSDYKAVKEGFIKQGMKLSNRPPNYFSDHVLSKGKNGVIFGDGPRWQCLKKFGVAALRRAGSTGKYYEEVIRNEAVLLTEKLSKLEGKPFDLSSYFLDISRMTPISPKEEANMQNETVPGPLGMQKLIYG